MTRENTALDAFEAKAKSDTKFIGHPVGLGWLSASEFWERFSYYGMQTLLVLYLTHYLLLPGHIEQVWGFDIFRHFLAAAGRALPWLFGHQTQMVLASNTAQLYAGLVYVTPLIGGILADRVIGRTLTVSLGATLMVIGTFLLVLNWAFLIGLLFLLFGVGCFKGNIASQVGDLYTIDDPRRADGFQIYFMGIQLAVIISPIICGYLSQRVEWHLGFVAAGVGMVFRLGNLSLRPPHLPAGTDPQNRRREATSAADRPRHSRGCPACRPHSRAGVFDRRQPADLRRLSLWGEKRSRPRCGASTCRSPGSCRWTPSSVRSR